MPSRAWFCSSFESLSRTNGATSSTRTEAYGRARKVRRIAPSHNVTNAVKSDNQCEITYEFIKKSTDEVPCSSFQAVTACSLVERFPPEFAEQLAVNPRKVDEVRQWILKKRGYFRGRKLLLLTGPTGSGKTATVQLLCREQKLELIEWDCSNFYEIFYDPEGKEVIYEENQVQRFSEFLKSADRGSIEKAASQKVVLVEQLPNVFYREPSTLHETLRCNMNNTVCMYIFIMSDVDSCWYLSPKRILPPNIHSRLSFDHIAFNASATTFLTKALLRITALLKVRALHSQVKRIAENSDGDIRTAINNLQLCISENNKFIDGVPLHSSTLVDPYHCLGKLLYAKRCDEASAEQRKVEQILEIELRRVYAPKFDITDVVDRSGIDGDKLVTFLHEHEPNFVPSLSSLSRFLDNISQFDSAFGGWEARTDSALSAYKGEVVARSTVFYNKGGKPRQCKGMYQFHKPRFDDQEFQLFSKKKEIRSAFLPHMYGELLSLTLPMVRLIRPSVLNYQQYQALVLLDSTAFGTRFMMNGSHRSETWGAADLQAGSNDEEFEIEEIDL